VEADVDVELAGHADRETRRQQHGDDDGGDGGDAGDDRHGRNHGSHRQPAVDAHRPPRRYVGGPGGDGAHDRLAHEGAGADEDSQREQQQPGRFHAGDRAEAAHTEKVGAALDVHGPAEQAVDIGTQPVQIGSPTAQIDHGVHRADQLLLVVLVETARDQGVGLAAAGSVKHPDDPHVLADRLGAARWRGKREVRPGRVLHHGESRADVEAEGGAGLLVHGHLVGPARIGSAAGDVGGLAGAHAVGRRHQEGRLHAVRPVDPQQERDHEGVEAADFGQGGHLGAHGVVEGRIVRQDGGVGEVGEAGVVVDGSLGAAGAGDPGAGEPDRDAGQHAEHDPRPPAPAQVATDQQPDGRHVAPRATTTANHRPPVPG
jgi:hypothetical protein